MGWFSKAYNPVAALAKISELMTIIQQRLCSLEVEVDSIKARFKRRLVPKGEEISEETQKELPPDGFDGLRKLNKEHGPQF